MEQTSRRQFIVRSGTLIGAFNVAGLGASAAARAAPAAVALEPARRETFATLAEAVVTQEPYHLPAAAAEQAAGEFAARYATWERGERARADAVLDALERAEGRSFRRADAGRRQRVLREHSTPRSATPIGQERERLDVAQAALGLLASVLGPDTDLDHSPTTV